MSKKNKITVSAEAAATQENTTPEQVVTIEEPKAEVKAEPVLKEKTTPVEDRIYAIVTEPQTPFKGKQRQIVFGTLKDLTSGDEAMAGATIAQVTAVAKKVGLVAKGGVEPSVRYHLHHLTLLGFTKILNPTYMG